MSRSSSLAQKLVVWFRANARTLPFRGATDPYHVLVSEIMAQQTRMEVVVPAYQRFVETYPKITDLARATDDDVMHLWAGLGYYSRARNLRLCAEVVTRDHGGVLPASAAVLHKLPGIGPYTAGAIASICHGEHTPAVDGNVRRVYARIETTANADAEPWVMNLMQHELPREITESLMELGALVCLPRTPKCESCPVSALCMANMMGKVAEFPVVAPKKPKKVLDLDICIARDAMGRILMRRRPEKLLHALWSFPDAETLCAEGWTVTRGEILGCEEHVFTHIIWRMSVFAATVEGKADAPYAWMTAAEVAAMPLATAIAKVRKFV